MGISLNCRVLFLAMGILCFVVSMKGAKKEGQSKSLIVKMGGSVISSVASLLPFSQNSVDSPIDTNAPDDSFEEKNFGQKEPQEDIEAIIVEDFSDEETVVEKWLDGDPKSDGNDQNIDGGNITLRFVANQKQDKEEEKLESSDSQDSLEDKDSGFLEITFENIDQILRRNKQKIGVAFERKVTPKKEIEKKYKEISECFDSLKFNQNFFEDKEFLNMLLSGGGLETIRDKRGKMAYETLFTYVRLAPVIVSFYRMLYRNKGRLLYRLIVRELREKDERKPIVMLLKKTLEFDESQGLGEFKRNLVNVYVILRGFTHKFTVLAEQRKEFQERKKRVKTSGRKKKRKKSLCTNWREKDPSALAAHILGFADCYYIPAEDTFEEVELEEKESKVKEVQKTGWIRCILL